MAFAICSRCMPPAYAGEVYTVANVFGPCAACGTEEHTRLLLPRDPREAASQPVPANVIANPCGGLPLD